MTPPCTQDGHFWAEICEELINYPYCDFLGMTYFNLGSITEAPMIMSRGIALGDCVLYKDVQN